VFEELSTKGYYWTALHYAMHFGKGNIILYIFNLLHNAEILNMSMKLRTNDNRSPLMCLLKSNSIDPGTKSKIMDDLISLYPDLLIEEDVKKECKERGFKLDKLNNRRSLFSSRLVNMNY